MSASKRPKLPSAAVDTNEFISAVIRPLGASGSLVQAWRDRAFVLITSQAQQLEVAEVIARPKIAERYHISPEQQRAFLRRLERNSVKATPLRRLPVQVRDPKDEKILALALGGKADYLVTGDNDLLVLGGDPRLGKLQIVTVHTFLAVLQSSE